VECCDNETIATSAASDPPGSRVAAEKASRNRAVSVEAKLIIVHAAARREEKRPSDS